MSRGSLTVTVTPSKRGLKPVSVNVEVENIEQAMSELHDVAPGAQLLDLILRIARRV